MAPDSVRSLLATVGVFSGVTPDTLAALAAAVERRTLAPGEPLFTEGEPGGFVFVVAQGQLEVCKRSQRSDVSVLLRVMGPGEAGGLTSTVRGRARSATLRARVQTVVLTLPSEAFLALLDERGDLVRSVLAHLGDKVRGKTADLADLLADDADRDGERVAFFDAKPYDRRFFDELAGDDIAIDYLETRLTPATASLARGARVMCAFVNDELSAATLERLAAGGVALVALRCAGFNHVDLEAAGRFGITVVRVPGYSPHAVAEHTVALILGLNRHLHRAHNRVREGNFSLSGLVGFDLHGKTAGIVGLGRIGRVLAGILGGFGMEVLGQDPLLDAEAAAEVGVTLVERDALLARSDVVCLTAPLTPETHHLINAQTIAVMKPGAMLINTGRGALVDTAALIEGLKSGRIGAAGLDVYEEEGGTFFEDLSSTVLTDDVLARLLTFPNVLVTSHQAFLTEEALRAIAATTLQSIRAWLAGARGTELDHVVMAP